MLVQKNYVIYSQDVTTPVYTLPQTCLFKLHLNFTTKNSALLIYYSSTAHCCLKSGTHLYSSVN